MKRSIGILVLALLVTTSCSSQAKLGGIARQLALGGSNYGSNLVLNPYVWEDPTWMLVNPVYQRIYRDYGWVNITGGPLDGYGFQHSGIGFGLSDELTLGTVLAFDPSKINDVARLIGDVSNRVPQLIPSVANVWEILAAYHMDKMDIGLGIMYGWSSSDDVRARDSSLQAVRPARRDTTFPSSSSFEASANVWGFRAGLLYDLGEGSMLDVSAAFRIDDATDKISETPVDTLSSSVFPRSGSYSASGTEYEFLARARFKVSDKFNFVPHGRLAILSAEPKEDAVPVHRSSVVLRSVTKEVSEFAYSVGIGGEYRTEALYLAGGVAWQYSRSRVESTYVRNERTLQRTSNVTTTGSSTAFPVINLGGEWWFTKWLAGRIGVYRSIGNRKLEIEGRTVRNSPFRFDTSTTTTNFSSEANTSNPNSLVTIPGYPSLDADALVTLGLGFRFGGFALDATMSERALRRGLGLIGAHDDINTFGYITASFNFSSE